MKPIQLTMDGKIIVVFAQNITSMILVARGTRLGFGTNDPTREGCLTVEESISQILTLAGVSL